MTMQAIHINKFKMELFHLLQHLLTILIAVVDTISRRLLLNLLANLAGPCVNAKHEDIEMRTRHASSMDFIGNILSLVSVYCTRL